MVPLLAIRRAREWENKRIRMKRSTARNFVGQAKVAAGCSEETGVSAHGDLVRACDGVKLLHCCCCFGRAMV
jgi:hypothetical protein